MPLANKHIVAIDDTDSILTLLRISLETEGATFSGAATASGGLAICETKYPDLVILDLGLPDHEGFFHFTTAETTSKKQETAGCGADGSY